MELISLSLENIRSYTKQRINFKKGITVLSGDIGSGKTTVLLAIEFALFGIIKGELNGDALLRHGSTNGEIELNFLIESNEITIKRTLKKTKKGIVQSNGELTINHVTETLTPSELKYRVMKLLGYPEAIINKKPTMIYNFSVYTPQESMKKILSESNENRLEIIRKIFGLDKYKTIQNNIELYLKELRSRIRTTNIDSNEIISLNKKIQEQIKYIQTQEKELEKATKEINNLTKEFKTKEDSLTLLEKKSNQQSILKQRITKLITLINNQKNRITILNNKLNKLNIEIQETTILKTNESIDECKDKLTLIEQEIDKWEKTKQEMNRKKTIIETKISDSKNLINSIKTLQTCPTCKQNVSETHKLQINTTETKKINELKEKLQIAETNIEKINLKLHKLKTQKNELNNKLNQIKINIVKLKALKDKEELKKELENEKIQLIQEIHKLEPELNKLKQQIDEELLLKINTSKTELNQLRQKLNLKKIEKTKTQKDIEFEKQKLNELKDKQKELETELNKIKKYKKIHLWLENEFLNLISNLETNMFIKIFNEFNQYFNEWFNLLINDSSLYAQLDNSFNPIIIQNGYETSWTFLSGGEKTSVALAYRLALNKVINNYINTIKTTDLIILDEPSDGFSGEQIDKLKEVIILLRINQIIIVTHEPKLESFANNIIKVKKINNSSQIETI